MSEMINNREYRQKILKELIMELHNGKPVEEVRGRFEKLIDGISPAEISAMEQSLIMEGMPVSEIQRLCDVHAAVFKGSIEEIHHPEETIGHPIHTMDLENAEIEKLVNEKIKPDIESFKKKDTEDNRIRLIQDFNLLWDIDKHYLRKENLLFPHIEKSGITAPPKVMWGVDDEIRDGIKTVKKLLIEYKGNKEELVQKMENAIDKVLEMIFKEKNILFPMAIDNLTEDEWIQIYEESDDIGYCLTEPQGKWKIERKNAQNRGDMSQKSVSAEIEGFIKFETGFVAIDELEALLNTLPFDITFIDKDDVVKYFSRGKERIFARTKAVIGRKVQNCHPPASVNIVEKILEDFKSGEKDNEDFWIKMGEIYVFIRYFAVRDDSGKYMGTLEVTQNIGPIKAIEGEKRLLS